MPTAPMAQRQVVDAPFPNVRVQAAPTDETYGGQIGDTVARASVRMYDLQTRSSDHAAVSEAENYSNKELLRIQEEVTKLRGRDASRARDYADEQWGKVNEEASAILANDRQRTMYQSYSQQSGHSLSRFAIAHFGKEDERFQTETYKASLDSSINVARVNAEDNKMVGNQRQRLMDVVQARANQYGYSGSPQHAQELASVESLMNREIILARVNAGNDMSATRYHAVISEMEKDRTIYNEETRETHTIKGRMQLTASDRDVVEKALQEGSTRGASRRTAQDLIGKYGIETADQRKAIKEAVNAIKDDKVADLTMQRLEHEYNAFDQIQNQVKDERFTGAVAVIDQNWKANPRMTPREMVAPSEYAKMSVQERATLDTYVNNLRNPGKKVTNIKVWADANSMLDEDLAKLKTSDIMKITESLDDGNTDTIMTRWNGVLNAKDGKKDAKYERLQSNAQILQNALDLSGYFEPGVPINKLPEEKQRLRNLIENDAAKALDSIPAGASSEVIQKTMQGVVDKNIKDKYRVDPGIFRFNKDVPAGLIDQYKDARSIRIPLKDIPTDRQDALKGALRSKGLPLTTQNIEELEAKARLRKQGVK